LTRPLRPLLLALCLWVAGTSAIFAQESTPASSQTLPNVKLRDIAGTTINTSELSTTDAPVIISFWATWCKPCILELSAYKDLYEKWEKEYGAKVVAVSIDDARNAQKVPGFIKGRAWPFQVLLDVNQDFKRALNVNNVPHTFLVKNGTIVWQHSAYSAGDEDDLEEELKKLTGKGS